MEIDKSLLENYSYACMDDCALCCLCQPELSRKEQEIFRRSVLAKGLTRRNTQGKKVKEPNVIKLQGGNGACYYLREKRCTIHDQRPAVCRQFPLHIHAMRRIQLVPNLACPNIFSNGDTLAQFGDELLANTSEEHLQKHLNSAVERVEDFDERCRNFGVYQDPIQLRKITTEVIGGLVGTEWIGKLLAWSNEDFASNDISNPETEMEILSTVEEPDIQEIAAEGNYDQLEMDDPALWPVHLDDDKRWIVFGAELMVISCMELQENGKLDILQEFPIHDIKLLDWDDHALGVFRDYASLLNSRDPFMGYAYQMCADQDYEFDLLRVYIGVLATTMLDLWWRASLIAKMKGASTLNGALALEGIRAYEMDSLGMPSIGTFI